MPLIECVPNVSEGRRADVIAALAAAIAVPGVHLLDRSSDPSHNRRSTRLPASRRRCATPCFACSPRPIASIDLRSHDGVHPRIGAVDVVPFVPLDGATMEECVALAKSTAALVAERFGVPVFLYEEAAATDERRSLAEIRRGGVERCRAPHEAGRSGAPTSDPISPTPPPAPPPSARARF